MRKRNEMILADLIAIRAEQKPDLDILTFEGAGVRDDEVRTYADLWENGNRIAQGLPDRLRLPRQLLSGHLLEESRHCGVPFGELRHEPPPVADLDQLLTRGGWTDR